jgi:hypothetical protein
MRRWRIRTTRIDHGKILRGQEEKEVGGVMPLKTGKSKAVVSSNIGELMHAYKEKGAIGHTKPGSTEKAQQIAAAIAYSKARGRK